MKKISIIVAIAQNNAIGLNNRLLWHIPADLKRFKKYTTGQVVVMGKNTFFSLPEKYRPLPDRINIVISDNPADDFNGCIMAYNIEDAIAKLKPDKENFIIGGASIYTAFYPLTDRLYLTVVHKDYEADTWFPAIDYSQWEQLSSEDFPVTPDNTVYHTFSIYQRKR